MKIVQRFFQFFKIDYDKLHSSRTEGLFWLDISMILLIIFNLFWIIFEFGFQYDSFQAIVHWVSPVFYAWYDRVVHPRFFIFDLIFVGVYIAELLFRWVYAIVKKTYEKWYYYPFIHWYDVLGCIPLSSFRVLRLFRVFAMSYRLQRLGIIDMTSTFIYKRLNKYLAIFTEEVSDRVVVNVLNGIQDELKQGSPVVDRAIRDILLPRQHILATWLARRIGQISRETFLRNEETIKQVLDDSLKKSLRNNKEVARLRLIPGAGPLIREILENSVTDITYQTIRESVFAFSDPQHNAGVVHDASRLLLESLVDEHEDEGHSLDDLVKEISVEVIGLVKEEVAVQQWKVRAAKQKAMRESGNIDL